MTTEPLPRATGAEYLTDALRRSGALGGGRVRGVVVDSARTTKLSRIIRMRLTYEPPAGDAPSSLILKTTRPDRVDGGWNGGRHEVAFYDQVASAMPSVVAPRCSRPSATRTRMTGISSSRTSAIRTPVATAWPLAADDGRNVTRHSGAPARIPCPMVGRSPSRRVDREPGPTPGRRGDDLRTLAERFAAFRRFARRQPVARAAGSVRTSDRRGAAIRSADSRTHRKI